MNIKIKKIIFFLMMFFVLGTLLSAYQKQKNLTLEKFIRDASANSLTFKEILIDKLSLEYDRILDLPASSLLLSIQDDYRFSMNDNSKDSEGFSIGMRKLFPYLGTELETQYRKSHSASNLVGKTEFNFEIVAPLLNNIFGRVNKLTKKQANNTKIIASYQIIESYESYLAELIILYYEWLLSYENMETAKTAYNDSVKLFNQIKKKRKYNIANKTDVEKLELTTITEKETWLNLQNIYKEKKSLILEALNVKDEENNIVPVVNFSYTKFKYKFDDLYKKFIQTSRTSEILQLLEKNEELSVLINKNSILPNLELNMGYITDSREGSSSENENYYAGFKFETALFDKKTRTSYKAAKLERDKQKIQNENFNSKLYIELKNLYNSIMLEKRYLDTADKKISLSKSILKHEREYFDQGRNSLNDLTQALNNLNIYKYSKITHLANLNMLIVEWSEVTDQLVEKNKLKKNFE